MVWFFSKMCFFPHGWSARMKNFTTNYQSVKKLVKWWNNHLSRSRDCCKFLQEKQKYLPRAGLQAEPTLITSPLSVAQSSSLGILSSSTEMGFAKCTVRCSEYWYLSLSFICRSMSNFFSTSIIICMWYSWTHTHPCQKYNTIEIRVLILSVKSS